MQLGKSLKTLRLEAGLTQAELAAASGVEQSYISRIERGARPTPGIPKAVALARALGTTVERLVGIDENDA